MQFLCAIIQPLQAIVKPLLALVQLLLSIKQLRRATKQSPLATFDFFAKLPLLGISWHRRSISPLLANHRNLFARAGRDAQALQPGVQQNWPLTREKLAPKSTKIEQKCPKSSNMTVSKIIRCPKLIQCILSEKRTGSISDAYLSENYCSSTQDS